MSGGSRPRTLSEWLAWQERLHPSEIELGLERVGAVLARLQPAPPPFRVITVAGTNGKGSCVAMLEAILRAAGYRVGAYTSPHLLRYNERIRLDAVEVGDAALCEAFERVEQARGETPLTYFEFGTLAALDIFYRAAPDVALLEVGMGGRLDAVNLLDADVALITRIAIDHTAWLGADRERIAAEKAGVLRPGRPAVYADTELPQALAARAAELEAPLYVLGRDFQPQPQGEGWAWEGPPARRTALPLPALRGAHQLANAAGVLMALEALRPGLAVSQAAVREGLLDVRLPGRFQVVPGEVSIVLDVAHNPDGTARLAENLRAQPCSGRTLAVVAMLADKDIEASLGELRGQVDVWYTGILPVPRAATPQRVYAALGGAATMHACAGIAQAFRAARADARPGDRIVVFGSFHTVAEVLPLLD